MAKPVSSRKPKPKQPRPPSPLDQQLPLVSGRWLAWSLLGIFGGGLLLVYLTLCLLFWQGQWQILFLRTTPVSAIQSTSPDAAAIKTVQFDMTEAGHPQLTGIFVSPPADRPYSGKTVLYLPSTSANAASRTSETLHLLQQIGIAAFTFNYRGSVTDPMTREGATIHPSEQLATEDTEAAWHYLVDTRHLSPGSIVIYGEGLGASLAAEAVARHPEAAGLVLDHPLPTALELLDADPRSRLMPVRLLTHDRFDPTIALGSAKQQKLFLLDDKNAAGKRYAALAADPKLIVYPGTDSSAIQGALKRFLDELRR